MLLQFSVSNFASIRDTVTISMVAGTDDSHAENLISFKKDRIQPGMVMYGANAAGKTNVIRAISAAVMMVRESNTRQITDRLTRIVPFLFDTKGMSLPTSFDFIIAVDGIKYEYGFSANGTAIINEYLYVYKSAKSSMIFERTETTQYKYTEREMSSFRSYEEKNTDNKLFLATATSWNCKETEPVFRWFANNIEVIDGRDLERLSMPFFMEEDDRLRGYVSRMLRTADLGIYGYEVNIENAAMEDALNRPLEMDIHYMQKVEHGKTSSVKKASIFTYHKSVSEDGSEVYAIPLRMESEGTRRFFYMSPIIKKVLDEGRILVIDEIDSSLHPFLLSYIISLFMNKEENPNGAQIVFNTQDVSILDLNIFRRDQIFFVEKDAATGATDVYSLDEFSPRKTADVRKRYLEGRYGALPVIGLGNVRW